MEGEEGGGGGDDRAEDGGMEGGMWWGGGHPGWSLSETTLCVCVCVCVCVRVCSFFLFKMSNSWFKSCRWSNDSGEGISRKMWRKGGRREEGGDWGNPTSSFVRVSAAELALFHTGAILSSLGYRPPATATWELSGGDKCSFRVRESGQMCVCVREAVVADNTFANRPPLQPRRSPSASTAVQSARDLVANLLKSHNFPLCLGIFVFFDLFSSAASPECYRGLYSDLLSICW